MINEELIRIHTVSLLTISEFKSYKETIGSILNQLNAQDEDLQNLLQSTFQNIYDKINQLQSIENQSDELSLMITIFTERNKLNMAINTYILNQLMKIFPVNPENS